MSIKILHANDLYECIKNAHELFDLNWRDRHLIETFIVDNKIEFRYDGMAVSWTLRTLSSS